MPFERETQIMVVVGWLVVVVVVVIGWLVVVGWLVGWLVVVVAAAAAIF